MSINNIARFIASAPKSPHLEAVKELRATAPPMPSYERRGGGCWSPRLSIDVAILEPLIVKMQRGYEGSFFTYLVTDGEVTAEGPTPIFRTVRGGTFTIEIIEVRGEIISEVKVRLRPGVDPEKVKEQLKQVDKIREDLRHTSKSASDKERIIEMVIRRVVD